MSKGIVISLYDFTGEALKPWADAGYECYAFDIQHDWYESTKVYSQKHIDESIEYRHVCTDMAVSGAAHFKRKAELDPDFQTKAINYAVDCAMLFEDLGVPYFIENPVSVLATKWRKPDHRFHPYEYGGYIPDDQLEHPRWPEYIAPRDAYPKKTCLWTGNGFVMPDKVSVTVKQGYAKQHLKLGGKSQRTKDIRSATPRGFAIAIYEANRESKQ